jgi:hypothetical protein
VGMVLTKSNPSLAGVRLAGGGLLPAAGHVRRLRGGSPVWLVRGCGVSAGHGRKRGRVRAAAARRARRRRALEHAERVLPALQPGDHLWRVCGDTWLRLVPRGGQVYLRRAGSALEVPRHRAREAGQGRELRGVRATRLGAGCG